MTRGGAIPRVPRKHNLGMPAEVFHLLCLVAGDDRGVAGRPLQRGATGILHGETMNRTTNQKLAASVEVLIGGEGPLPFRMFCIGSALSSLSPDAFDDHHQRSQFVHLRDTFIMLGFCGGDDDGRPWHGLRNADAMTLAVRVLDLCMGVALRESEDRNYD